MICLARRHTAVSAGITLTGRRARRSSSGPVSAAGKPRHGLVPAESGTKREPQPWAKWWNPSHGLNGMVSACDVYVFVSGRWRVHRARAGFPLRGGGGCRGGMCRLRLRGPPTHATGEPWHTTRDGTRAFAVGRARPACRRVGRAWYRGRSRAAESHRGSRPPAGGRGHCVGGRGEWGRTTRGYAFGRAHVPDAVQRLHAWKREASETIRNSGIIASVERNWMR